MADSSPELTSALEDYLETIYEVVLENKVARVRDIAKARGVRAGSVTPAMKRLASLGLIKYVQREYIDLTPEGEKAARKIYARHRVLMRFFKEILGMPAEEAREDACSMEHSLSAEGMDHMVRFFEFFQMCPSAKKFLDRFHNCGAVQGDEPGSHACLGDRCSHRALDGKTRQIVALGEVPNGTSARVAQIGGDSETRQQLINMGVLPNMMIEITRKDGDDLVVRFQAAEYKLSTELVRAVFVHAERE